MRESFLAEINLDSRKGLAIDNRKKWRANQTRNRNNINNIKFKRNFVVMCSKLEWNESHWYSKLVQEISQSECPRIGFDLKKDTRVKQRTHQKENKIEYKIDIDDRRQGNEL